MCRMKEIVTESFTRLKSYCESEGFKGWDPYDGLNSKVFNAIPFLNKSRLFRLIWMQSFKRNPINLRKVFLVAKDYNPKGLGLFLSGYCNLYRKEPKDEYLDKIQFLTDEIIFLISKGYSGACWGYNFNWQARAFLQPKYTPTVVASTFNGYALLNAYDILKKDNILETATSVKDFILKDLNRTYDEKGNFAFSYSPKDKTQIYNASLLGSRMLARIYSYTKEPLLIEEAKKSVEFCCSRQNQDGSWNYGTLPYHSWIDNFHTGYNLECIQAYKRYSADTDYDENLQKGLQFYLNTFFTETGISKYYHNKIYPIDIHAPAQLIVTLGKLGILTENLELANRVLNWTIRNMQSRKGYFYFSKTKYYTSKIPYIRWAQGWMFYALSEYLSKIINNYQLN